MAVQHKGFHLTEKLAGNKGSGNSTYWQAKTFPPPSCAQMDLIRLPSPPSGVPS